MKLGYAVTMVTSVTLEFFHKLEFLGRHMIRVMRLHIVTSVTSELFSGSRISRPTYVHSYVVTLVTSSYKYYCKIVEKVFFLVWKTGLRGYNGYIGYM